MQPSDVVLYAEIARSVGDGAGYYETAAELHRARSYPLVPFYTVRSPAQAYLMGYIGPVGMLTTAYALLLAGIASWFRQLGDSPFVVRLAFLGLYGIGGGALISPSSIQVHETWVGLLVSLALGLGWAKRWQLGIAFTATMFREIAAPILVLLWLWNPRRWEYPAALAIFLVAMVAHYFAVDAMRIVGDASSQGWWGLRGVAGLVEHVSTLSFLPAGAMGTSFILVAIAGWAAIDRMAALWFIGISFAIAVFARPDNLFWSAMLLPALPCGLALLGSVFLQTRRRIDKHAAVGG